MQTISLAGRGAMNAAEIRTMIPRAQLNIASAVQQVQPLMQEVRDEGVPALFRHAEKFDGVRGHALRVPEHARRAALSECPHDLVTALEALIEKLRRGSAAQVPEPRVTTVADGATIEQRWQPVDRVGLYVPGGKAVYPSSVVMNTVAAQTAGVPSLAIASPVQRDTGQVHSTILAAAQLLGVDEVYAIGGASAIAAFAYGVPELQLEPVDVVTGPGNIYVAAAKREVQGLVGIDAEAGTTEILIIADASAHPTYVASDLISQAEHDEAAASVLVTDSAELAQAVQGELERLTRDTPNRERAVTALSGQQSAIIIVDDIKQACRVSNVYAPEHLEIITADPRETLRDIRHAGAIFLGPYTPVSLGDYLAGSNHVLPTGGTARFAAGLGAYTFLRPQQIVTYSQEALARTSQHVRTIATNEGLPAHADAVSARLEEGA